jgi:heme-degrading monooxygenase HmoA
MIARLWRGATRAVDADAYWDYLQETGLSDYTTTPGNMGAFALRRNVGDRTEWLMISLWRSLDDIRAFAGDDVERARYYPRDEAFLISHEDRVEHFDAVQLAAATADGDGVRSFGPPPDASS